MDPGSQSRIPDELLGGPKARDVPNRRQEDQRGRKVHKPIRVRPRTETPQMRAYDGEPKNTAGLTSVIPSAAAARRVPFGRRTTPSSIPVTHHVIEYYCCRAPGSIRTER